MTTATAPQVEGTTQRTWVRTAIKLFVARQRELGKRASDQGFPEDARRYEGYADGLEIEFLKDGDGAVPEFPRIQPSHVPAIRHGLEVLEKNVKSLANTASGAGYAEHHDAYLADAEEIATFRRNLFEEQQSLV